MYARPMADAATLRQNVEDLLTRLLAGGEIDLAPRLVHPDFVNNEASPERRAARTAPACPIGAPRRFRAGVAPPGELDWVVEINP
jgi:hypothetical protein